MNMCPTNKCKTAPESCLKGQVFFIWTSCSSAETLKNRISLLGGKVEQFLSKDVTTILVEDNQLLVPDLLSPELSVKSTYAVNGNFVASFPYPSSITNIPSTSSGYNFIANTSSKPSSPYRIICYARQWGIQVLGIAEFLTWTEPQIKSVIHRQKQRKPPENVSNLTGYFIKFENVNKNYRPCYKMFNNDPNRLLPLKNASVLASVLVPENCNVISNPVSPKQLNFSHMDTFVRTTQVKPNLPVKANEKKAQNNKLKPKEENNYCECCKIHFDDIRKHIKSSKHQRFVSNDKNYESVHNILKMLPTPQEFIENLQNPSPNADSGLTNGDIAHCISGANVPDAEVSVQLNLQVRKDNVTGTVIPVIERHPERNVVLPQSFQMPKDEVMPLPLDLHIKREDEVKNEVIKIKQEPDVYVDVEQIDLLKKEEINPVQPKLEANNDLLLENIKVEEKQPVGLLESGQCDEGNGGDFLDRTNTAVLAQLCLKNFASYCLDSLPSDVDIYFDDIFDFNDGKTKQDEVFVEPFGENTDVAQTPGLVSSISTPNLKTQNTGNTSVLLSSSIDVKNFIKVEPPDLESLPPTCNMGKEIEAAVSSQDVISPNESQSKDKKPIFSIASYCTDKISNEPTPSCSTAIGNKNSEPLFSSESSDDDENGNVLISNALDFITNSDNETKIGKESEEENTVGESLEKVFKLQNDSVRKPLKSQIENKMTSVKETENPTQLRSKETSSLTLNSSINEKDLLNNDAQQSNSKSNALFHKTKVDSTSKVSTCRVNVIQSNIKDPIAESEESKSKIKSSEPGPGISTKAPAKAFSSDVDHLDKLAITKTSSKPTILDTSNLKAPKEEPTSTKEKEWDYTCNKIYKKYPIPLNRTSESMTMADERGASKENARLDNSNVTQQKCVVEEKTLIKSNNDKYPNPKKNISLREKTVKNNSEVSSNAISVSSLEKGNWPVATIANTGLPAESMMDKRKTDLKTKPILTCPSIEAANETACDLRIDQVYFDSGLSTESFPSKGRDYHSGINYPTDLTMNSSVLDANSSQQSISWENKMNPYSYGSVTPMKHSHLQENKQDFKESSKGKGSSYVPRTNFASVDSIVSEDRYFGNPEPVTPTKNNDFLKGNDHSRTFSFKKHYMKQNQYLNVSNANIISPNVVSCEENLNLSNLKVISEVQNPHAPLEKIVSRGTSISKTKVVENVTAISNALHSSVSSQNKATEVETDICNKDLQSHLSSTDKTNSSPEKKDRSTDSNTSIASAVSSLTENSIFSSRHDLVPARKSLSKEESLSTVTNGSSVQLQPSGAVVNSLPEENILQPKLYAEDLSIKQVNIPQKNDKNMLSTVILKMPQEGSSCIVSNTSVIETPGITINSLPSENKLHEPNMSANNTHSLQTTVHRNAGKSASTTSPSKTNCTPTNNPKIKLRTSGGVVNSVLVENRLQPLTESPQPKHANIQRKSAEKLGTVTNSSCNASTFSCFNKVKNNFEHFAPFKRKSTNRRDNKAHKKMKKDSSSLTKLNSECVRNDAKEKSLQGSINPCQYSYRTAKYNVDNSSNSTSVKFTSLRRTVKIPPKEKSQKLRELPPLWTVSVNGVKLKFTRIYPEKVDAYQYVTEDDSD